MQHAPPPFDFPPLPLAAWKDTRETLHLYAQIVGKIRLGLHPKLNHWWHVPLYLSARGLTTGPIPYGGMRFEIAFDFLAHALTVTASDGAVRSFALDTLPVAAFYDSLIDALAELGIDPRIDPHPYDVSSKIPFAEDRTHAAYDKDFVHRFWQILGQVDAILEEFRGRFVGKSTPVHLYWHSFDLALTRFSGRAAPAMPEGTQVNREAYSHEVISFGFWPGDDNVPAPAFYSYTYPEPPGLRDEPLKPAQAAWQEQRGNAMALYMYDDMRAAPDPKAALLEFLQSAYEAGARRANWSRAALDRVD